MVEQLPVKGREIKKKKFNFKYFFRELIHKRTLNKFKNRGLKSPFKRVDKHIKMHSAMHQKSTVQ